MRPAKVNVRELIAWGLDADPYRDAGTGLGQKELARQVEQAQRGLTHREHYSTCPALLANEAEGIEHLFTAPALRDDLQEEYEGLKWTLGVVDLRRLLAFQRRLVFSPAQHSSPTPQQDDWPGLVSLAAGLRRGTEHHVVRNRGTTNY